VSGSLSKKTKKSKKDKDSYHETCRLTPANGYHIRLFPDLWAEIGLDNSILLLQIDHWLKTEPALIYLNAPWLHKSAKQIAFELARNEWSRRKTSRLINDLTRQGLLTVFFHKHGHAPYITIDYEAAAKLKSLEVVMGDHPWSRVTTPLVTGDHPLVTGDHPLVTGDHPTPYTDQDHDPRNLIQEKEGEGEGENKPAADLRPTGNSHSPSPSSDKSFQTLKSRLAQICKRDPDLFANEIKATARQLWKNGTGYTAEDLDDFAWWWKHHDYRGKKASTPYLAQVLELIRESYDHPDNVRERELRKENPQ